jgi:hypothetical protein
MKSDSSYLNTYGLNSQQLTYFLRLLVSRMLFVDNTLGSLVHNFNLAYVSRTFYL